MYIRASDNRVEEVWPDIYEPPRFFETFLRGRSCTKPPDITARICGICPVAYQIERVPGDRGRVRGHRRRPVRSPAAAPGRYHRRLG
jgi:hypothetical protein